MSQKSQRGTSRRGRHGATLLIAAVFGLLLWARLLLVTNHPRTAIADPPVTPAAPATASAPTDTP
jgi:hypothetical protein